LKGLLADAAVPAAAVLIACPYSIRVTFGKSRMAVWDSHIHGNGNALVALSCQTTTKWLTIIYIFVETLNYVKSYR
jgi:hypothetical protein